MHSSIFSKALAAASLAHSVSAHIIMANPVPYSKDLIDNGPLATAADYPCKQKTGFNVTQENQMKVGDKQTLSFTGTAVHNGGSCQLSVTTDRQPTESSIFKVIKTIHGGCPGTDGAVSTFDFTLPPETPNGELTFAWTWQSKSAGKNELYMNCAPITVTGGKDDTSGLNSLPDMVPVNKEGFDCKQTMETDVQYPDPGQVVETWNNKEKLKLVMADGSACGAPGAQPSAIQSGSPDPAASSAVGEGNNGGGNDGLYTAEPTPAPTSAPAAPPSTAGAPPPNSAGGVFAPGASSIVPAPASPTSTLTTLLTVTAPAADSTPPANPPAAIPNAPTPSANVPATPSDTPGTPPTADEPPSGNDSAVGQLCASGGDGFVCDEASKNFGHCVGGKLVGGSQQLAAGQSCTDFARKRNLFRAYRRHI